MYLDKDHLGSPLLETLLPFTYTRSSKYKIPKEPLATFSPCILTKIIKVLDPLEIP